LFEIDAPLKQRFKRFINKYPDEASMTLEEFVDLDDNVRFTSYQ